MTCPFCLRIRTGKLVAQTALSVAFDDAYPVSPGHMLVTPKQHEEDFRALSPEEQSDALELALRLANDTQAKGINIGINIGESAGQTVPHAHIHVIPRDPGDVSDPRGGVRWVIPDRAAYWEAGR